MSALLRLAFICICSVLAVVLSLFLMRHMGSWQTYQAAHHPWMERKFLLVQRHGCSIEELVRSRARESQAVHVISLLPGPNSSWSVECKTNYPLRDLLTRLPDLSYLFEVKSKSSYGFDALGKDLALIKHNPSVGFMSASHVVIRQLRKEFPQWLFVADPTTLVKIHLFESLFIETMADIWPDIFVTHNDIHKAERLTPRLVEELVRRKKIIIWDDTSGNKAVPEEILPHISGVLTTRPTWAFKEFESRF